MWAIPYVNRSLGPMRGVRCGGQVAKLWQSCTIDQGNAPKRFRLLANQGPSGANTLHTLSGFPGLGM
ncbi:hypothetical protein A8B74_13475 [Sulfitobacter geojensis]|nr:hypothetical protein Z947_994 [Sulfitobacter geojensis]OAN96117.1 hypothetical protein A8B74_13475 [Sulfitobacter geojensis]